MGGCGRGDSVDDVYDVWRPGVFGDQLSEHEALYVDYEEQANASLMPTGGVGDAPGTGRRSAGPGGGRGAPGAALAVLRRVQRAGGGARGETPRLLMDFI